MTPRCFKDGSLWTTVLRESASGRADGACAGGASTWESVQEWVIQPGAPALPFQGPVA